MKRFLTLMLCAVLIAMAAACSSGPRYHSSKMPDPKSFNAHYGDFDANGDETVSWEEFKAYFKQADKKVFSSVDMDKSGGIDHDEWHAFKEAHGLKDHD
jgi:hypothetical protein